MLSSTDNNNNQNHHCIISLGNYESFRERRLNSCQEDDFNDVVRESGALMSFLLEQFKKTFFHQSYDLFCIYRPEEQTDGRFSSDRYGVYQSKSLVFREEEGKRRRRLIFGRVLMFLTIYFIVKFIPIYILTGLKDIYPEDDYLRSFKLDDPYSSMPAFKVFVYVGVPITILSRYNLTLFNKILDPCNYANIRFIYDPKREIKRIDLSIESKLANLLNSLELFSSQKFDERRGSSSLKDIEFIQAREQKTKASIMQQIMYLKQNKQVLRPATYNVEYFQEARKQLSTVYLSGKIFVNLWMFCAASICFFRETNYRCKLKALEECHRFQQLTLMDWYMLMEISLMIYILFMIVQFHDALASTELNYLFKLINGAKENLQTCLAEITKIRMERERRQVIYGQSSHSPSSPSLPPVHTEYLNENLELDKCLLKGFLQLRIAHGDIKLASRNVTREITALLNDSAILVILWLTSFNSKLPQQDYLRLAILVVNWFSNNGLAFASAKMVTEIIRLEKISMRIWNEKLMDRKSNYLLKRDFVFSIWRKIILSSADLRNSITVRPHNIALTFDRLVSINLFIFSLNSVLYYK